MFCSVRTRLHHTDPLKSNTATSPLPCPSDRKEELPTSEEDTCKGAGKNPAPSAGSCSPLGKKASAHLVESTAGSNWRLHLIAGEEGRS